VHDWVIYNVEYDGAMQRYTAYDALFGEKTSVCQGYALLGFALLTELGIETRIVDGVATSGRADHAWNMVKVDGAWLHLDMTHNDPVLYKDASLTSVYSAEEKADFSEGLKQAYFYKYYLLTNAELRKVDVYRRWSEYCPEVVASISTLLH
jgi:transglutaminase-like putative cysteine protease